MFRGEKEDLLALEIDHDPEAVADAVTGRKDSSRFERRIAAAFDVPAGEGARYRWLADTVRWAWRTRISMHLDLDLRSRLRQVAEEEAIRVFAGNLHDLLLAAPAGGRATMGLDPGLRTGVKVAVVDATRVWPPTPSTRTCRTVAGMPRSPNWRRWPLGSTSS